MLSQTPHTITQCRHHDHVGGEGDTLIHITHHTCTHTTRAHTYARAHTHTHTHTQRTSTLENSLSLSLSLSLSHTQTHTHAHTHTRTHGNTIYVRNHQLAVQWSVHDSYTHVCSVVDL